MDFHEFVEEARAEIDDTLKRLLSDREDRKIIWKMIESGKRLRPILCILSFKACNGSDENYNKALNVAAAIELCHCASLCHDDIVDRDVTRRGKPALWVEAGIPDALMAGHRAILLGLQISFAQGAEVANTFLGAWDQSLRGGLMEIDVRKGLRDPIKFYFDIISKKTASLFSGASKVGAQIAYVSLNLQAIIEDYGMAVGVAYQIADDMSELHEKKEEELSSLMGKVSNPAGASYIQGFLNTKIEAAIKKAEDISRDEQIPEGEFKSFMSQLPRYFVDRILRKGSD